jgi:hypothetical protein
VAPAVGLYEGLLHYRMSCHSLYCLDFGARDIAVLPSASGPVAIVAARSVEGFGGDAFINNNNDNNNNDSSDSHMLLPVSKHCP